MPPPFSAKKIEGVPAYKLARKGEAVELKPKEVEIKELIITDWDGTRATFCAWVSSGTYLRSLAHDMGKALGIGRPSVPAHPDRGAGIRSGGRPYVWKTWKSPPRPVRWKIFAFTLDWCCRSFRQSPRLLAALRVYVMEGRSTCPSSAKPPRFECSADKGN